MKAYTTMAGAERASNGGPIVRLLQAGPLDLFVTTIALDTEVHVLTADRPRGPHRLAGSMKLMDAVDLELMREDRRELVRKLEDRARNKREDQQGFDAKLLEDAAAMLKAGL